MKLEWQGDEGQREGGSETNKNAGKKCMKNRNVN